ncbi:MAG: D-alanine--D-alanine ligase [Christensenellales bacterium]
MKNIAVVFGGNSCERDISIITGVQLCANVNTNNYNVYPLLYENDDFYLPTRPLEIDSYIKWNSNNADKVYFRGKTLIKQGRLFAKKLCEVDCVVLCTHGGDGENGVLQGFFECVGVPYTSAGVCASAVAMNKSVSKAVFRYIGCRSVESISVNKKDYDEAKTQYIIDKLSFPIIVKPSSQGSSIGIKIASDQQELIDAIETAFCFDDKIIAEKALTDFDEVNVAIVAYDGKLILSSPEQPVGWKDFLTFEDKYIGGKMSGSGRIYPAEISDKAKKTIYEYATKIYEFLDMKGVVRMDFMIDRQGKIYINEVNTIPGSMAYYLFEEEDIDYDRLIDMLVEEAIRQKNAKARYSFKSDVLNHYEQCNNACKNPSKLL